ncbi:MAG: protoheme IX farnesyltransferase [Planctomycetota bacterium]|jgi:protoheme IX farnesyltransferase
MTHSPLTPTLDTRDELLDEPVRFGEWMMLLRPRLATLVVLAAWMGALMAVRAGGVESAGLWRCFEAALYVALVTGAASVLNQVFERDTDALMDRTKERPLVQGRIKVRDAIFFGLALATTGTVGLVLSFNMTAALLNVATLLLYIAIYTPLKRVSTLNTLVGAISGAAPPLLGFVAIAGESGPWAWALFAMIFAWQFPHFMAIAYIYREDYARAGMRMIPAMKNSQGEAGRQSVLYATALLPVSLLPLTNDMVGLPYLVLAIGLGVWYLMASIRFARNESMDEARNLLRVSLVYLPVLFCAIVMDPLLRTLLG